jgi:two-component system NtrC family sensor kinase
LMLIRGHLKFIDDGLEPDHPVRANFETIERAARRIEEMARRMLDFSRKSSSHTESYDLAELVADSVRFLRPYFQEQDTDVKVSVAPDLPQVNLDRGQMVQAMVNLLQNAAEAMANTESRSLSVSVTCQDSNVRIAVADTGRGIGKEDLPRIFTPFFTTKGERGTGLGLYITKKIVEEHQGSISVKTGSGGTTFVIFLPLR